MLAPKMCPDQSQAFKEVNNSQAFTVGSKKKRTSRFQVLQGMFVQRLAQMFEELSRTNIKLYLTPKIESTQKPSDYDAKS